MQSLIKGTLFICATPIGNLEDASFRLIRVLREADFIAAEDTRTVKKLLARYEIFKKRVVSYYNYSKKDKIEYICRKLEEGENGGGVVVLEYSSGKDERNLVEKCFYVRNKFCKFILENYESLVKIIKVCEVINEDDIYDVVQIAVKNVLDNIKQVREIKLEPVNKLELSEFKKNIRHTDKNTIPTLKHQKKQKLLVDNVKITGNYKQKPDLISKPDKTKKLPPMEYIGQLFKTYLLFSDEENFYLIDQHAAHERIRLEQLLKANSSKPIRTQKLISPIKIDLLPGELIDIKKIIPLLSDYGFEISHFGGTTFIVKGIPIIFKKILTMDEIKDLLDELIHIKGKLSLKDLRNKIVNLLSCKGAIKANTVLSDERAINLVKELSFCQNPFSCCHGRPTIISFSKNEIEKKFKRT